MSHIGLRDPLASLRIKLQAIDLELVDGERLPSDALEDLKSAVDDVRLRVWAALAAARSDDRAGLLLRFRLRRAIEICGNVTRDLEEQALGAHQGELLHLRTVARELLERIDRKIKDR
jgi:hypothetical protein